MPQFTPGPWKRSDNARWNVYASNNGHGKAICTMRNYNRHDPDTQEADHNAELISRSPELLECLQDLLDWAEYMGGWNAPCWVWAQDLVDQIKEGPDHETL